MVNAAAVVILVALLAVGGLIFTLRAPTGHAVEPWWLASSHTASPSERQAYFCRCVTSYTTGSCIAANCYSDDVAKAFCNKAVSSPFFCQDCALMGPEPYTPKNVRILASTECAW